MMSVGVTVCTRAVHSFRKKNLVEWSHGPVTRAIARAPLEGRRRSKGVRGARLARLLLLHIHQDFKVAMTDGITVPHQIEEHLHH